MFTSDLYWREDGRATNPYLRSAEKKIKESLRSCLGSILSKSQENFRSLPRIFSEEKTEEPQTIYLRSRHWRSARRLSDLSWREARRASDHQLRTMLKQSQESLRSWCRINTEDEPGESQILLNIEKKLFRLALSRTHIQKKPWDPQMLISDPCWREARRASHLYVMCKWSQENLKPLAQIHDEEKLEEPNLKRSQ